MVEDIKDIIQNCRARRLQDLFMKARYNFFFSILIWTDLVEGGEREQASERTVASEICRFIPESFQYL